MGIVAAIYGKGSIAGCPDGNFSSSLIADISIHVRINDILSGCVKLRERMAEVLPVLSRIHVEERIASAIVQSPAQRDLAGLSGGQFGNDRTVPGNFDIDHHIWLASHANDFAAYFRGLPAVGGLVLTLIIEVFD